MRAPFFPSTRACSVFFLASSSFLFAAAACAFRCSSKNRCSAADASASSSFCLAASSCKHRIDLKSPRRKPHGKACG